MFQIKLVIGNENAEWLACVEEGLKKKIIELGGCVEDIFGEHLREINITCGREDREWISFAVREALTHLYCTYLKTEFFKKHLRLGSLSTFKSESILRTLVAFDRERDGELVDAVIKLKGTLSVDGYFKFRLGELEQRWMETVRLTEDNLPLLYDDGAFNLLLKFLLSAVSPLIEQVTVKRQEGGYIVVGEDSAPMNAKELFLRLIDIAPLEVIFDGELSDSELARRTESIFEVKKVNNRLKFGENIL